MKRAGIFLLLFTAAAPLLFSQGATDALRLALPGTYSGTRAIGLGNSYDALSDDATAMFFNPAGLGLIRRMEFAGSLDYYNYGNDASFFRNTTNYSSSSTQLSSFSLAFPFPTVRGSLVFGISYNQSSNLTGALKFNGYNAGNTSLIQALSDSVGIIYDLYLNDDNGVTKIKGGLQQSGTILQSGDINNWSFASSVEIAKSFFLGGTLNIISGTYENNNKYYEDDVKGLYDTVQLAPGSNNTFTKNFLTFYRQNLLNWEVSGWDFKLGMLYQLGKSGRVGATLQFPKSYTIKEKFAVDGYSDFAGGIRKTLNKADYEDAVTYDISTPFVFTVAGAYSVLGFLATAQVSLTDYSQTKFENPEGLSAAYISSVNQDMKENLRAVANYNAGLEYTFAELGMRLRAGYFVQKSPYKGDGPEYDRKFITGGAGFLIDDMVMVDLGYARGTWKDFGDNYGSGVSRTEQEIITNKFILGFSYRF